jgi:hypothetical protein
MPVNEIGQFCMKGPNLHILNQTNSIERYTNTAYSAR